MAACAAANLSADLDTIITRPPRETTLEAVALPMPEEPPTMMTEFGVEIERVAIGRTEKRVMRRRESKHAII